MLPHSEISSSCRSDQLYVNSFVVVTTYFMEQTSTIQSVDTLTQGLFIFLNNTKYFLNNTEYSVLII